MTDQKKVDRELMWTSLKAEGFLDVREASIEVLGADPTASQLKQLVFALPEDVIQTAVEWGVAVDTRFRDAVFAFVREHAIRLRDELGIEVLDETSRKIADAYQRDLEKPALKAFKEASRYSRKFGFPIVCTLQGKSELEQLHWAASLLVEVAGTWPREDVPSRLEIVRGTALFNDAQQLLANGLGNASQALPRRG